ncbi:MAG: choice-of-anchor L domain-containing protein, partial [Polyangiaceae bacterium]|nr:choice-of-anchor L domain-containing protein [Polyangiaceae bacterium]
PPCDTGGNGGSSGSGGGGSGTVCNSKPGDDKDADGFKFPEDCNDCDPNVNPGALDLFNYDELTGAPLPANKQVDEDCDGTAVQVEKPICDTGLALAEADPIKGANAIDICQTTTANSPKWGIISAQYVQLNGAALPNTNAANLGRGIMTAFGPNVDNQLGDNMLVLSSGTARIPGQPGYQSPNGFDKNYTTPNPTGFPVNSPSCPGINSGPLHDSIGLKLRLRAPTNAKSISFKFKFYTYEYPYYICSQYNDIFVAIMRDKDGKFIEGANQQTGNISFDKQGNYLSVNAGFLEVCSPGTYGGKQFDCPLGTSELQGTGFEGHAATGWLQTNAPVKPGEEFEIIFGISDAGDGILDSTVLLDSFEWSANEGKVQTGDECKLGGSGSCASCLSKQIPTCCEKEYTACIEDKEGGSGAFNPGCNGILNCIQICAGNAQCQQQCYDTRPNGQPEYNAYRDCLYGPANDPDNSGACGKVCQLGSS